MPITKTTEVVTSESQVKRLAVNRTVQVPMQAPSGWDWAIETTVNEICILLEEALNGGQSLLATDDGTYVVISINDDPAQ